MYIYRWSRDTGVYLGKDKARLNPRDTRDYLIPACATTDAPPSAGEGKVAVRQDEAWVIMIDCRGDYLDEQGVLHTISMPGEEPGEGWVKIN